MDTILTHQLLVYVTNVDQVVAAVRALVVVVAVVAVAVRLAAASCAIRALADLQRT
jgi:hypothetical protein